MSRLDFWNAVRRSGRRVRPIVVATVFGAGILTQTAALAGPPPCVNLTEAASLNVRLLQTELMVAALSCQQKQGYNTFVRQFKSTLIDHGRTLRAVFSRHYGNAAEKHINAFITRIANETSLRSSQTEDYCAQSAAFFKDVLRVVPANLPIFASAQSFSGKYSTAICTADLEQNTEQQVVQSR